MTEKKQKRSQSRRRSDAAYRKGYLAGQQAALAEGVIDEARIQLVQAIDSAAAAARARSTAPALGLAGLMVAVLSFKPALVSRFMAEGVNAFLPGEADIQELREGHLTLFSIDGEFFSTHDLARQLGIAP